MDSQTELDASGVKIFVDSMPLRRALETHILISTDRQAAERHASGGGFAGHMAAHELRAEHEYLVELYATRYGHTPEQAVLQVEQRATALKDARRLAERQWTLLVNDFSGDVDKAAMEAMKSSWLEAYAYCAYVSREQIALRLLALAQGQPQI